METDAGLCLLWQHCETPAQPTLHPAALLHTSGHHLSNAAAALLMGKRLLGKHLSHLSFPWGKVKRKQRAGTGHAGGRGGEGKERLTLGVGVCLCSLKDSDMGTRV